MYSIQRTDDGLHVILAGQVTADEMDQWLADSRRAILSMNGRFHVVADLRQMDTLGPDANRIFLQGKDLYKKASGGRWAAVAA